MATESSTLAYSGHLGPDTAAHLGLAKDSLRDFMG